MVSGPMVKFLVLQDKYEVGIIVQAWMQYGEYLP